jgi:NAD(P)-dependent dehydrogenase (short-subunit alcohol dehydrogenase family)
MKLSRRVAVITGAGRGFGASIAQRFSAEGADLVLSFRTSSDACEELAERHRAGGGRAIVVRADVTDAADVAALAEAVRTEFGGLDILVNNAGVQNIGPFAESEFADWEREIQTNVVATLAVTRAFLPLIRGGGTGRIINLSSQIAAGGWELAAVYAGTKSFITSFTKSIAREFGPQGITVNAIGPGSIRTDMNAGLYGDEESIRERASQLPLRRLGSPDDVASCAAFLASDDASFITGHLLTCNGGAVL